LAGRDELSAVDKEEVLAAVLAKTEGPREAPRPVWLQWAVAFAAVALVVLAPMAFQPRDDAFAPRGAAAPELHVACGAAPACRSGDTLMFQLKPQGWKYFSAVAKTPAGGLIWYFDDVELSKLGPTGVLSDGITLGPEHAAGRYQVLGLFAPSPLGREAIKKALDAGLAGTATVQVAMVVEP
jgi:hypothetical protein